MTRILELVRDRLERMGIELDRPNGTDLFRVTRYRWQDGLTVVITATLDAGEWYEALHGGGGDAVVRLCLKRIAEAEHGGMIR